MLVQRPTESEIREVLRDKKGEHLRKREIARIIAEKRYQDKPPDFFDKAVGQIWNMLRAMKLRNLSGVTRCRLA